MLPVCRTPPGQYTGIPQAHPETEWLPGFEVTYEPFDTSTAEGLNPSLIFSTHT